MSADLTVDYIQERRVIRITIDIPEDEYRSSLFPNETLRESVNTALATFLDVYHNRR